MTRDEFNNIIHKHNRKLFAIAFRILRNRQEAEDVVQDVFLKMWMMGKKLDEYYLQNLISIDDEYTSSLNARCLKSLTEFYGDKSKAEKVHRKNLDIQKKINERE